MWLITEMVGEVAKESSYCQISWWRGLVSSIPSCYITQDFPLPIYCFQLCSCGYECKILSLHMWISGGDGAWDISNHLQVWILSFLRYKFIYLRKLAIWFISLILCLYFANFATYYVFQVNISFLICHKTLTFL